MLYIEFKTENENIIKGKKVEKLLKKVQKEDFGTKLQSYFNPKRDFKIILKFLITVQFQ